MNLINLLGFDCGNNQADETENANKIKNNSNNNNNNNKKNPKLKPFPAERLHFQQPFNNNLIENSHCLN